MADETVTIDEEAAAEPAESRNGSGSGPGFLLGVVLGMLAGAAGAALFAPRADEDSGHDLALGGGPDAERTDAPEAGVRSVLDSVRARVRDASEEAREAAREAEEQMRARYDELTHEEPPA